MVQAAECREKQDLNDEADRMVSRWARRLLLQIDGEVRRLTQEEIELMCTRPTRRRAKQAAIGTRKARTR